MKKGETTQKYHDAEKRAILNLFLFSTYRPFLVALPFHETGSPCSLQSVSLPSSLRQRRALQYPAACLLSLLRHLCHRRFSFSCFCILFLKSFFYFQSHPITARPVERKPILYFFSFPFLFIVLLLYSSHLFSPSFRLTAQPPFAFASFASFASLILFQACPLARFTFPASFMDRDHARFCPSCLRRTLSLI